ncbi:MAG: YceI family protein [Anaerolineae bacterium]
MAQWTFDPTHSNADFAVRHMMVTTVRGGFKEVSGTINYDKNNPAASTVEAVIKTGSIWTGVGDRDAHLRSADFLNADVYPEMTFKSNHVEMTGENTAKVTGDLTIRDVTNPVVLNVELIGEQANPFTGAVTLGFTATTKIDREAFNLTWNMPLANGGVLVGKEVTITLDVEAVPVTETANA